MKGKNKQTRSPLNEQTSANKMTDKDKIRMAVGRQARLDVSQYLRDPENEGYTLFWATTENAEVDKWLGLGAEPVRAKSKSTTIYKGLNDSFTSEWATVPGVGMDEAGKPVSNVLLKLPDEDYYKLRVEPKEARNREIRATIQRGKVDDSAKPAELNHVTGLKTYAPNNPDGGIGLSIKRETHDV